MNDQIGEQDAAMLRSAIGALEAIAELAPIVSVLKPAGRVWWCQPSGLGFPSEHSGETCPILADEIKRDRDPHDHALCGWRLMIRPDA